MTSKKLIGSLAISGALLGGGIAGAMLGAPTISLAETLGVGTVTAPARGGGTAQLDAAAKALGMTTADLQTQLDAGKTIAQVASAKGVDVNTVIDAMVAAAQSGLRQRITDFVNNGHPKGEPGHFRGPGGPMFGPNLDAAASALGITNDELMTALLSGKSIAQVASDRGVAVQKVIDAIVAAETTKIDQALSAGRITQSQADSSKSGLLQRVTDLVNRAGLKGRGFGHDKVPDADDSSSSPSSSSSSSSSGPSS